MSISNRPGEAGMAGAANEVKEKSAEIADQAKAQAASVARQAASAATDRAEAAKDAAADELSGVASALRKAADEMRGGSPQERTFGQLAEGLADASDAMRSRNLGEMARDVSDFARRNPMVFLGGAALIGFAATRFAKASGGAAPAAHPAAHHPVPAVSTPPVYDAADPVRAAPGTSPGAGKTGDVT